MTIRQAAWFGALLLLALFSVYMLFSTLVDEVNGATPTKMSVWENKLPMISGGLEVTTPDLLWSNVGIGLNYDYHYGWLAHSTIQLDESLPVMVKGNIAIRPFYWDVAIMLNHKFSLYKKAIGNPGKILYVIPYVGTTILPQRKITVGVIWRVHFK